jgi:ABC-type Mn2+/Zn2+ transport system permease subunit
MLEPFLLRALALGLLLSLLCSQLGCFVLLRRLTFVGDALAHSLLPGVVLAHLMGVDLTLGALLSALVSASLMSLVGQQPRLPKDTGLGVVFTGAFALGVVLVSSQPGFSRDLTHFLFGNILAVSLSDLAYTGAVCGLVLILLRMFYHEIVLATFDPIFARRCGISLAWVEWGMFLLLALAVVAGVRSVGVVLVSALLITPAATARLLCQQIPSMLLASWLISSLSTVLGLSLSYLYGSAAGASIVLVACCLFAVVLLTTSLIQRRK